MRKHNILILNSSIIYGGGEYFVLQLASELRKKGLNVIAGCSSKGLLFKKLMDSGIKTKALSFPEKGSSGLWKVTGEIKRIITDNNINVVHSNTGYDRTAGAYGARGTKAVHITSCHSLEPISHNLTHFIRNKYLTSHFIADGSRIKQLLINKNGIKPEKISVVHNGIDPGEMSRDEGLRKKIRNQFNLADDEILIGSVGRLVAFKGYKYLISAFKILSEEVPHAKLMIVGDGELMAEHINQARMLNMDNKIIFTGFRDDLKAIYSAFDVYANSSIEGGGELFPFSILYAMAQELPVVASTVGDIPEMIIDNKTGYLAGEKSPYQTASKLIEVIKDPARAKHMGEAGKLLLLQKFTLNQMTDKIINVYNKAVNPAY